MDIISGGVCSSQRPLDSLSNWLLSLEPVLLYFSLLSSFISTRKTTAYPQNVQMGLRQISCGRTNRIFCLSDRPMGKRRLAPWRGQDGDSISACSCSHLRLSQLERIKDCCKLEGRPRCCLRILRVMLCNFIEELIARSQVIVVVFAVRSTRTKLDYCSGMISLLTDVSAGKSSVKSYTPGHCYRSNLWGREIQTLSSNRVLMLCICRLVGKRGSLILKLA